MNPRADLPPSGRLIRLMAVVSLLCGVIIVAAHKTTLEPIRRNQAAISRENVALLLPGASRQIAYGLTPAGEIEILTGDPAGREHFLAVYDQAGSLRGIVWEAAERGYADLIRGMFAYDPEGQKVTGFRAVELKETPGLGDKIGTDPGFLANFRALDARLNQVGDGLANAIRAVKHGTKKNEWEIDAVSGATVSSRAVGRMLDRSARRWTPVIQRHLDRVRKGH
ncbi:MAG: FMN-binding protein [Bryobacteraceae bacterium]|nr:FMN-binding protein [Bryobacteraceae bacterium]